MDFIPVFRRTASQREGLEPQGELKQQLRWPTADEVKAASKRRALVRGMAGLSDGVMIETVLKVFATDAKRASKTDEIPKGCFGKVLRASEDGTITAKLCNLGGTAMKVKVPPHEWHKLEFQDEHLRLGVTVDAALDFLQAAGFPDTYQRSEEHIRRNGALIAGEETGYDLTAHIETFMTERGFEAFSVAEVLYAAGHPGVDYAQAFLSHIQSEHVKVTLQLMLRSMLPCTCEEPAKRGGSSPLCSLLWRWFGVWGLKAVLGWQAGRRIFFVDYFSLRQCVDDFIPEAIYLTIDSIGFTSLGLSQLPSGEIGVFQRAWCLFEVYCTLLSEAALLPSAVQRNDDRTQSLSKPFLQAMNFFLPQLPSTLDINFHSSTASRSADQERILAYLDSLSGGADGANARVANAMWMMGYLGRFATIAMAAFYVIFLPCLLLSSIFHWLPLIRGIFASLVGFSWAMMAVLPIRQLFIARYGLTGAVWSCRWSVAFILLAESSIAGYLNDTGLLPSGVTDAVGCQIIVLLGVCVASTWMQWTWCVVIAMFSLAAHVLEMPGMWNDGYELPFAYKLCLATFVMCLQSGLDTSRRTRRKWYIPSMPCYVIVLFAYITSLMKPLLKKTQQQRPSAF